MAHAQLGENGVGINHHGFAGLGAFRAERSDTGDTDQKVCPLEQIGQFLAGHAVVGVLKLGVIAVAERHTIAGEGSLEVVAAIEGIHFAGPGGGIVREGKAAAVFQEIDFMPEFMKPQQVIQMVPGHPAQGVSDDVSTYHDRQRPFHGHQCKP